MEKTKNPISFSISNDCEIESICLLPGERVSIQEVENLLLGLISSGTLHIGERCEGDLEVTNNLKIITYHWCSELGEDWDSDLWEDEDLIIPND